ncbi:unnamed protein product [Leuciscus chuanchicus]
MQTVSQFFRFQQSVSPSFDVHICVLHNSTGAETHQDSSSTCHVTQKPLNVNVTVNSDEDRTKGRGVSVGLATFLREVDEWPQTIERCTRATSFRFASCPILCPTGTLKLGIKNLLTSKNQ